MSDGARHAIITVSDANCGDFVLQHWLSSLRNHVDLRGIDVGTWVARAQEEVARQVELPPGYTLFWSGQYEYMQRAKQRLLLIVPLTLAVIFLILYFHTKSIVKTLIVLSAIPFSLVGSIWLMSFLDYNWSIAVWVGVIALAGLAAETGVVMLLYLDIAYEDWRRKGKMSSYADLAEAVDHGAVQRIRPKMMTVMAILFSLVPILWSTGTGADVMRRIAAPMVGGVFTSFVAELVVAFARKHVDQLFAIRVIVKRVTFARIDVNNPEGHLCFGVNLVITEPLNRPPRELERISFVSIGKCCVHYE